MHLSRRIALSTAVISLSAVLTPVPAEAAACPAGVLCVYSQIGFRGFLARYTTRDLRGGFDPGDGGRPFTRIMGSLSAQNRLGFGVIFATRDPKACFTFPCPQYGVPELVPNGTARASFVGLHDLVRPVR